MYVYVGNLPATTTEKGLSIFARLPMGSRTRIIRKYDVRGAPVHFGLIYSRKDRHAQKIINRLDGTSCRGHALEAREFHHRSPGNDRRTLPGKASWGREERRMRDRRTFTMDR
jgi:hypothetical protein